jgi:proline iminopeptidase
MKIHLFLSTILATSVLLVGGCKILDPEQPGLLVPKTVDEDPALPSITVNGTQLHSEAFGKPTDPMIVVVHSGPGGDYRYLLNCKTFAADGFYVVFYDQRGSGLSKRQDKSSYTSVQQFIDDLGAVIQHYKISPDQKVFLLGQSWGAMLATAYVNEHPTEIAGVVMSEPGGFTWSDAKAFLSRSRPLSPFAEASNDFVFVDQIITGSDHIKLDYKAAVQSASGFAPGNKLGYTGPVPFWRFGAVCSSALMKSAEAHPFDFTTNLRAYKTKVLFMYSELDQAYGKAHAESVSSAYPNVQLIEVKGVGHVIPYFAWEQFYQNARTYLNSLK